MTKVLSVFEFQKHFATEDQCFDHLVAVRWPDGFKCPKCNHSGAYIIKARKLFQCKSCKHQTSVTAGTCFHRMRQPLHLLFWAVYLVATNKKGISALELQRKLDIRSYQTAWTLLHKIRSCMTSSGLFLLSGEVEVDETYIDGSRSGPTGRGADNKQLVAVAVEKLGKKMGRSYFQHIQHASKDELGAFVKEHVTKRSSVITDGFPSYKHLKDEYNLDQKKLYSPERARELLPNVHIVITNTKAWLRGTFNRYPAPKHLKRYLNEFEFRFNRRWKLDNIFDKLLNRCLLTNNITYAELTG